MSVTWRDRAHHLRGLWRIPTAIQASKVSIVGEIEALRAELALVRTATATMQQTLAALLAEQEKTRLTARTEGFRLLEGTAAATLQLVEPRLTALEQKIDRYAAAVAVPGSHASDA